jgi:outer membrane protein assembly factor BamC
MKKILGVTALVIAATSVSGCGWLFGNKGVFRDRGNDYRQASLDKPLEVPAGLNRDAIEDQLVIPRARGEVSLEGEFEVPRPEPVNPSAEAEQVKLQKLGEQSWILVEAAPGEVWPRVRQFLTTNQLTVLRADATGGIIETAWLNPATGSGRERYRFRIEQGVQRGSSEVYILQADNSAGETTWPTTSSNPQRESEMMKVLAQFIADNGGTGAVSMLAQKGIDAQGKVFVERMSGQPQHLRLALPFNRAWASLEIALPKAGFAVDDTNRGERYLTVHYDPPIDKDAEKKGFFTKIWDWIWGDDDAKADVLNDRKTVYTVTMQNGADINSELIMIARQDGKDLAASAREKLLVLIKSHLI